MSGNDMHEVTLLPLARFEFGVWSAFPVSREKKTSENVSALYFSLSPSC